MKRQQTQATAEQIAWRDKHLDAFTIHYIDKDGNKQESLVYEKTEEKAIEFAKEIHPIKTVVGVDKWMKIKC